MGNQVRRVLEDLIETLEDGRKGFAEAADRLAKTGRTEMAAQMRDFSEQRSRFSAELRELAADQGMEIGQNGSLVAGAHRGWMAPLREALSTDQATGVLSAAESGEEAAGKEYSNALDGDLPEDVRMVLARQSSAITAAHAELRAMRDGAA